MASYSWCSVISTLRSVMNGDWFLQGIIQYLRIGNLDVGSILHGILQVIQGFLLGILDSVRLVVFLGKVINSTVMNMWVVSYRIIMCMCITLDLKTALYYFFLYFRYVSSENSLFLKLIWKEAVSSTVQVPPTNYAYTLYSTVCMQCIL